MRWTLFYNVFILTRPSHERITSIVHLTFLVKISIHILWKKYYLFVLIYYKVLHIFLCYNENVVTFNIGLIQWVCFEKYITKTTRGLGVNSLFLLYFLNHNCNYLIINYLLCPNSVLNIIPIVKINIVAKKR